MWDAARRFPGEINRRSWHPLVLLLLVLVIAFFRIDQ